MLIADFVRTEVWHALSVHFPIAFLPLATITLLISFAVGSRHRRTWQVSAVLLLFAGCLTAWVAIYTGNEADGLVARKICDPTVLKQHENASQTSTWLFTAAAAISVFFFTRFVNHTLGRFLPVVICLIMLTATGFLVQTGRLGASLVYEQGAGVRNYPADCPDYP